MNDETIKSWIIKIFAWTGYGIIIFNFQYPNKYLANTVGVYEVFYWLITVILLLATVVMFLPNPDEKIRKMAEKMVESIREKPTYAIFSKWFGWGMVVFVGVIGDWSLFTVLFIMNCVGSLAQQQAMNIVTGVISGEYDSSDADKEYKY